MPKGSNRAALAGVGFAFGFVLLAVVTAWMTDGRRLVAELGSIHLGYLAAALACAAVSYFAIAWSFSALLGSTPHAVPFRRVAVITLLSTTFNYVVSTAGLSSIAVRLFLFKKEKVPVSVMAPISVAQSMLTNVVLAAFCLVGLLVLGSRGDLQGGVEQILIWGALGVLVALVGLALLVFLSQTVRRRILSGCLTLWHWTEKKVLRRHQAERLPDTVLHNVDASIRMLQSHWGSLGQALGFVTMDWVFTALTLGASFLAAGVPMSWGYLMVGFALAFLSTTINIFPGGLGVMEGLLAVTYAHFGVAPEKALVAALLFRVTYFLIPLGISSLFYLETLKRLIHQDLDAAP